MAPTTTNTFDAAGFQAFLTQQSEPDWMIALRREAFEHAEAMDWPARRHEEWIRTDIRTFQIDKFGLPATEASNVTATHQLRDGVELGGAIETVDGFIRSESLAPEFAEKGVVFGSLSRTRRVASGVGSPTPVHGL